MSHNQLDLLRTVGYDSPAGIVLRMWAKFHEQLYTYDGPHGHEASARVLAEGALYREAIHTLDQSVTTGDVEQVKRKARHYYEALCALAQGEA